MLSAGSPLASVKSSGNSADMLDESPTPVPVPPGRLSIARNGEPPGATNRKTRSPIQVCVTAVETVMLVMVPTSVTTMGKQMPAALLSGIAVFGLIVTDPQAPATGVLVAVGVAVGGTGVLVGVLVGVAVGGTGVLVGVSVGVAVGGTGVLVGVSVGVAVGGTGVLVGVSVGVAVGSCWHAVTLTSSMARPAKLTVESLSRWKRASMF